MATALAMATAMATVMATGRTLGTGTVLSWRSLRGRRGGGGTRWRRRTCRWCRGTPVGRGTPATVTTGATWTRWRRGRIWGT
eukprot:6505961-Pyramimonas_sp.AAC.1